MKICPNCHIEYTDELNFCKRCGTTLIQKPKENKSKPIIVISCIVIVIVIVIAIPIYEVVKQNNIKAEMKSQRIQKELNKPQADDLTIDPGWTMTKESDYLYVNGSVTNSSSKSISYYEVKAYFYDDEDEMVDSDYTSGSDIEPGETQTFEIMHKDEGDIEATSVEISDIF